MNNHLQKVFGARIENLEELGHMDAVVEAVTDLVKAQYESQEKMLGHLFDDVKQKILLQTIDTKWKDHLLSMDHLKDGINLRSFAQKDPLIEYKKEAYSMFQNFHYSIREEALELIFKIRLGIQDEHGNMIPISELDQEQLNENFGFDEEFDSSGLEMGRDEVMSTGGPEPEPGQGNFQFNRGQQEEERKPETFVRSQEKVGRNDPCPCGSGKKFKQCHGKQ
jgi:preprotein translocase subunit SecA